MSFSQVLHMGKEMQYIVVQIAKRWGPYESQRLRAWRNVFMGRMASRVEKGHLTWITIEISLSTNAIKDESENLVDKI